jgi:hypothetical protein
MSKSLKQEYILVPPRSMVVRDAADAKTGGFLRKLHLQLHPASAKAPKPSKRPSVSPEMEVLDSIREDGAKLVRLEPDAIPTLRAQEPGVRILPVVYYSLAIAPRPRPISGPTLAPAKGGTRFLVKVVCGTSGAALKGADVKLFTNYSKRQGVEGVTNSKGEVGFYLGSSRKTIDRAYVFPPTGYWGILRKSITVKSGDAFPLRPVDLGNTDSRRYFYPNPADDAGTGVSVAIVDTGVSTHPDLLVQGGRNVVTGEDPADIQDNGTGHGTHVAGIVGGRGVPPSGTRGIAPGAALRAYRVFGSGKTMASNFAIAKAIDQAVSDGCDLINLSLGGGSTDPLLLDAIADARAQGSLVLVANGNDGRSPVSFPANSPLAIAVSAMGRIGTFPNESPQRGEIMRPFGLDRKEFISAFSNVGNETSLTAPGVGVVSTVPGGYAVMDGTSMACPAATGMAAVILGSVPAVISMKRDQARSDEMARLILERAQSRGFGPAYEGKGLLVS